MHGYYWAFFILTILLNTPLTGSIIKKPSRQAEVAYQDLTCTETDQKKIYDLISTLGNASYFTLLLDKSRLEQIGADIRHVHPLKFLAYIFRDPHLKSSMRSIWADSLTRSKFFADLKKALNEKAMCGKILVYLFDFAKDLQLPPEILKTYMEAKDWEGLMHYLMQN